MDRDTEEIVTSVVWVGRKCGKSRYLKVTEESRTKSTFDKVIADV